MPINDFTVGRDVTLNIVTPSGALNVSLITDFQSKQETVDQKIKGLDGVTRPLRFYDSWTGSFIVERQDSTLDDYFSQSEANFYAGVSEGPVSITETIQERSGALSQYRYVGVLMKYDDAGAFRGDASVKQSVSFFAARRLKIT